MSLAFNRRAGTARLCFLAENAFVGVAELELDGGLVAVQLTGTEAARECDREMCGADDCCGDVAFGVTVAGAPLRGGRQSFVALNTWLELGLADPNPNPNPNPRHLRQGALVRARVRVRARPRAS